MSDRKAQFDWKEFEQTSDGERFHIDPTIRVPLIGFGGGIYGFLTGLKKGFRFAGDRFLVENSHRLPTTKGGWYFYHKRKNWICFKEATHQGIKSSLKTSLIVSSYFGTEALLDYVRGQIDFFNTLITTVSFGAGYAYYYGLSPFATKQLLKNGVILGLGSGLVQDVLIKIRGGDIWYLRGLKWNPKGDKPLEV